MTFIMLAPMEGVMDAVTRQLYSQIGGFDRFVTEFIRVTDKLLPASVFYRYSPELKTQGQTAEGTPVYVQLLGGQANVIAENATHVSELGAPGIDLNFGCPAPTVNRHDGGATLLKKPERVFDVVSAVRKAVPSIIPVTAKVRLGFSHKDFILDIAKAVEQAGASMMTVHARTRDEGYRPPAHWEYIARMRESVKIPVIANGDIWTVGDYIKCREMTGCYGVALGRGALSKPDLALQIRAHLEKTQHNNYSWNHIQQVLLPQFIETSTSHRNDHQVAGRTKQWLRQLTNGYAEAGPVFEQVKRLKTLQEIALTLRSRRHPFLQRGHPCQN